MPIARKAIDRFLAKKFKRPPRFKGMAPRIIRKWIKHDTDLKFSEVTPSRPHQLEGTAFALHMGRALILYWMRLGKSKIALDWSDHLRAAGLVRLKGLIIAHAPIGVDVWTGQIQRHSTLKVRAVKSTLAGGRSLDDFLDAADSDCDVIVISIHLLRHIFSESKLSNRGVRKRYPDHERLRIAAELFDHCVIDETHFYGNPGALNFQVADAIISHCKYRIGLTGTPIGRNPFMAWSQCYLIDQGKRFGSNYYFFEQAYGKSSWHHFKKRTTWSFDKKKLPEFKERLDTLAITYGKNEIKTADVYEGIVELRMYDEQRQTYNDAVEKMIKLRFDERVDLESSFVKLRQIASGYIPFVDNDGHERTLHFPSIKLDWLKEFVTEVPKDCQCVIFHEYVHTGELICEVLKSVKIKHTWIWGKAKDKPGKIKEFQDGKAQILVANTATGGTSIDLPQADYLLFFESPCSPITRAQAQARPMDRGNRLLLMDDLVASPVEHKILGFIREGENYLSQLLRGKSMRGMRKELIAD